MRNIKALFAAAAVVVCAATANVAQAQVKVYRTKAGKRLTSAQKDSISALGFPVVLSNPTTSGDTSFLNLEILPKESELVQRYKNQPLPDFELKTVDGKSVNAQALRGKVVMLNFWSVNCPPCIEEMPELNKLKEKFKDVVFLGIAPDDAAKVQQLLTKHPFHFSIAPDAGQLFYDWEIIGYPKSFFIDRHGIVRELIEGTPLVRAPGNGKWQVDVLNAYTPILTELLAE